jgi:2-oxoglutarate dehydrogenase E2 component (dihydrolipoamide succinyltransferase)
MPHEIQIPDVGESIQEVQIGQWLKSEGDWVEKDETVVEVETDKASVDLAAPISGVLSKIIKKDGEGADIGEVVGMVEEGERPETSNDEYETTGRLPDPLVIMPAAQRMLAEHGLQGREVEATGPGGRLLKEDVQRHVERMKSPESPPADSAPVSPPPAATTPAATPATAVSEGQRVEEAVPMTLIRRRIAARLVEAQQTGALLTTFNEIDMSAVMALRKKYRDTFQEKHDVKLGFMSFFVKASIEALKQFPAVNAEIRDKAIIYRNYYDVGVAIGGGKGLVVPVLRNAERMSFAEIEVAIGDFAARAKTNKLRPDEFEGGTFTITNGGVYGSLLSTPIINPPQSGVLGLHSIQERPVAENGQVAIRPMMYVALTYDHRLVDGREAVTFLRQIKEILEEPARMLLEV